MKSTPESSISPEQSDLAPSSLESAIGRQALEAASEHTPVEPAPSVSESATDKADFIANHPEIFSVGEAEQREMEAIFAPFLERIPPEASARIIDSYHREGYKSGNIEVIACLTRALGLKNIPGLKQLPPQKGHRGLYNFEHSLISFFDNRDGSARAIRTMGHEMWHAYQHGVVYDSANPRSELYRLNFANYIPPTESYRDYSGQLVECEATAFGRAFLHKIESDYRAIHPEIYHPDAHEITATCNSYLQRLDHNTTWDLIDQLRDNYFVGEKAAFACLAELLDLKDRPKLNFRINEKDTRNRVSYNHERNEVIVDTPHNRSRSVTETDLYQLAHQLWRVHQIETSYEDSEQGSKYWLNLAHRARRRDDRRAFLDQLIERESRYFASHFTKHFYDRIDQTENLIDKFKRKHLRSANGRSDA